MLELVCLSSAPKCKCQTEDEATRENKISKPRQNVRLIPRKVGEEVTNQKKCTQGTGLGKTYILA